jgi:hypothetical protein
MDHDAGLLHAHEEQALRDNAVNRVRGELLSGLRHPIPNAIKTSRGRKQRIAP